MYENEPSHQSQLRAALVWAGHLFGAAFGAGVISASLALVLLAHRLGEARVLSFSLIAWELFMIVFSRLTSFGPGLGTFFLLGVSNAGINVTVGPLLLHTTPRKFVGRISSVMTPALPWRRWLQLPSRDTWLVIYCTVCVSRCCLCHSGHWILCLW